MTKMRGFWFEARTSVPGVAPGDGVRFEVGALTVTTTSLDLGCVDGCRAACQLLWLGALRASARKITGELEPVPVPLQKRPWVAVDLTAGPVLPVKSRGMAIGSGNRR